MGNSGSEIDDATVSLVSSVGWLLRPLFLFCKLFVSERYTISVDWMGSLLHASFCGWNYMTVNAFYSLTV